MNSDKRLALMVAAVVLIVGLAWATVAVAQNISNQRACFAVGCVTWENCQQGPGCPRYIPAAGQGGACACCN